MKKITYTAELNDKGTRLDVWLTKQAGETRSQLQKRFKAKQVLVNDKPVSANYVLKGDETISLVDAIPDISTTEDYVFPEVPIVAETADYVVVNKPAGITMHSSPGVTGPTLVQWLVKKYPKIAKVGDDPNRPGIVHRLDREVSGLVVVAKTQKSFDSIKSQFMDRTVRKKYQALAHGAGFLDTGVINFNIERSSQGYKMAAKPTSQSGRTAITEFEVMKRFHNYTLLDLTIKTGRTHQIRAHLSAYTHPVLGDDLYAGPKLRAINKKMNLGRIFLVATELAFNDLKGERQTFTLELPEQLKKILKTIAV